LSQNPILKVLSTLNRHRVRYLLMGGQACVFYGAAEFSRDTDIVILAESANLERLAKALDELKAVCIALPPFEVKYLKRGHAVHFRCRHPQARGIRLDVMSVLRGVDSFPKLWRRRTTMRIGRALTIQLMSVEDLVQAKKTQRDKDWPMVRRLVEAHYAQFGARPNRERIRFWLRESRTPEILTELARRFPRECNQMSQKRPLLTQAREGGEESLTLFLEKEERDERITDRAYWIPLRQELAELRRVRLRK
jgi:hypothetical protein